MALFGGSFDPVHRGHLQAAEEAAIQLGLEKVTLVPCHIPPHKASLHAAATQRLMMLRLALTDCPHLEVSEWELQQGRASYTLHSVQHFRELVGDSACLVFLMGWDSLQKIDTWYQWQDLLNYCNFAVWPRPGYTNLPPKVERWAHDLLVTRERLKNYPAGKIAILETSPIEISSTELRTQLATGHNPEKLLPGAIFDYIRKQKLYGVTA